MQPGSFKVSMEQLADPAAMSTYYIYAAEASNADFANVHSARQGLKTSCRSVTLDLPALENYKYLKCSSVPCPGGQAYIPFYSPGQRVQVVGDHCAEVVSWRGGDGLSLVQFFFWWHTLPH